jgi:hypothetical protein
MHLFEALSTAVSAGHLEGWSSLSTELASIAAPAKPFFWESKMFQKPWWVDIMFGFRVGLCLLGALLVIAEVRARRLGVPVQKRATKWIAIAMTALAFLTYFDFGNPNVRYRNYYHRHEFYHYYLGSKYFDEVRYTRLYDCTLIAEVDSGRRAQVARREFRDLRVNLIKPVSDTYVLSDPDQCKKHFTAARWEEFKKDVDWFQRSAAGSYWERMQQDHGYNPPPVWTMAGKFLGSFSPADDAYFKLLASLDVVMQLGMLVLLGWAFGYRIMAVGALFWGCNAAANFYWTGGAFLRQDWMFLLVASICFARKRMFFWAGAALMWSALLRVFPAVLFFGWAVIIAFYVLGRLRGRPAVDGKTGLLSYVHPSHRQLIAGAVVAMAVLVPASILTAGGVSAYKEFAAHISVHKKTPLTNHMGLPTILTHTWEGRMRFTRDDNLDDAFEKWKDGRNERKEKTKPLQYAITAGLALWIAWALRRTKLLWVGPALSLPLVMCLTDLTCYYYSMYIAAAVIALSRRPFAPVLLTAAASSVILLGRDIGYARTGWGGFYYVDDNFTVQSYIFFLLSLLMIWTYSRPFSMERLKAWWAGKPEPRPTDGETKALPEAPLPAE